MSILVSYNQISVFDPDLDEPFNDWSDAHVRQGFSWRPGSVSFAAAENVETDIDIARCVSLSLDVRSMWAIGVPFTVPAPGVLWSGALATIVTSKSSQGCTSWYSSSDGLKALNGAV
jgi:hypothetical protein